MAIANRRALLGPRLLLGFEGVRPERDFLRLLVDFQIGGILLFKRNFESPLQLASLTRRLQQEAAQPLLIAVDHEGGRVQRLGPPFTRLPSARELGKTGSEDLARRLGQVAGRELAAVGVHLNLAPVVDVLTHPANTVIGDRSFGSDPLEVARQSAAFIRGQQAEGVAACAKHFPGHGATEVDSHQALPRLARSLEEFRSVDFPPFREAISAGVAAIMTAHLECPEVDDRPATLSRRWIRQILRGELAFSGVVLSDDLDMKALSDHRNRAESALEALRAGCDLVLVSSGSAESHRQWIEPLLERAGRLPAEESETALSRLAALKKSWVAARSPADPEQARARIPDPSGEALVADILRAASLA